MFDWSKLRVMVTGGGGFLGRPVCALLRARGCRDLSIPRKVDYDLTDAGAVQRLFEDHKPQVVIHLAAKVGGIGANRTHPGQFFYENMAMGMHLIEEARKWKVLKFVQASTACAYPKITPVPFKETDIWNGYPEETNAPYAIAKKAVSVMLQAYCQEYGMKGAVVIPVNLYGPYDNFDPAFSHVIPALVKKCVEAVDQQSQELPCWGTGEPSREFLYVDDAAEGVVLAAERIEDPSPINLGTGREVKIRDVVQTIARLSGFTGRLVWDSSKPDGQPRRSLDTARAGQLLGFQARTPLDEGLKRTIDWYRANR